MTCVDLDDYLLYHLRWVDEAKQAALVLEGMRSMIGFSCESQGKYLKRHSITCSSASTQRSTKLGLMSYDIRTIYYEGEYNIQREIE